ncbi:MAG: hypothetical protein ACRCZB_01380 [Bacteroidales bacterium]
MERKLDIEEVRSFIAASERQFANDGMLINRIRFKRGKNGEVKEILIDYSERDNNSIINENQQV